MTDRVYTKADFFCGAGGMLLGYEQALAERSGVRARFRTAFAVDAWATAAETCERMTGAKVTIADLFEADHYVAFYGRKACWCGSRTPLSECHQTPPPDWREMQPEDLRRLCPGGADIIEGSPPCKAFSRLTPGKRAKLPQYQALNSLVVRWLWLWLNAFPNRPPRLILMENVPDIADPRRRKQRRGEALVSRVEAMLAGFGYACRRTTYDCGKVAGGAQHRHRFLLVARHVPTTQAPLLEPFTLPMQTIGDVIGDLPPPTGDTGIAMHQRPKLARKTEEKLLFVEAGGDWRSIEPNWQTARSWRTVEVGGAELLLPAAEGGMPDPRLSKSPFRDILGINGWDNACGAVTGRASPTTGRFSVQDPRLGRVAHNNVLRCADWHGSSPCVTGGGTPTAGGVTVSDPRLGCTPNGATLRVVPMDQTAPTVTGTGGVWSSGSLQLADPRVNRPPRNGAFGVQRWDEQAATVTGSFDLHCGPAAVEAPVPTGPVLIAPDWKLWRERGVWRPSAWHRALTLRELADLQTFPRVDRAGQPLQVAGTLDEQRMQVGNAVPPAAARVFGEMMLATLLSSDLGVSVTGGSGIWVREGGVLRWKNRSSIRSVTTSVS